MNFIFIYFYYLDNTATTFSATKDLLKDYINLVTCF